MSREIGRLLVCIMGETFFSSILACRSCHETADGSERKRMCLRGSPVSHVFPGVRAVVVGLCLKLKTMSELVRPALSDT